MGKMINKRTADQIQAHRTLVSELMLKGYKPKEIREQVEIQLGVVLTPNQITTDMERIRQDWFKHRDINYSALLNQELARLDVMEQELWSHLRASAAPKIRRVIERFTGKAHLSEEELAEIVSKITETSESTPVDPRYFSLIEDVRKERRKLLGLYAPETKQITQRILIKGYKDVSPSDWDDVVEGQVILKELAP